MDKPRRVRKALTLRHPWPWAIANGKDVENRNWAPRPSELAPGERFAIHGGRVPAGRGDQARILDIARKLVHSGLLQVTGFSVLRDTILEGVVAVCRFEGVVVASRSPWFEGPKGWILAETLILPEPIPWAGARGLWDVPPALERRILEALDHPDLTAARSPDRPASAAQGLLFDLAGGDGPYGRGP